MNLRKNHAKGANQLRQVSIAQGKARLKFAGGGPQTRQTDANLRLPAMLQEVFDMRGQGEGVLLPGSQSEQDTNAEPPKAGFVAALGAIEPPIKIALRASRVQTIIKTAIVCLLVNDETFGPGVEDRKIIFDRHRAHLDGDRREHGRERAH